MSTVILSIIPIIISSVSMIIIGISALLLWKQIKRDYEWNREKTSQETLNTLVTGEFPDLKHKLEDKFKCAIGNESQTYVDVVKCLSKNKIDELDEILMKLLNIFEAVTIAIKNDIINENICYDYLGWIMAGYYRWGSSFVIKIRRRVGEPRVLENFEYYAQKWTKRINEEKNKGRRALR